MNKTFVHATLLDELREVFVQGEIASGSKVPEAALCERFAVSRTPLREALKVLAAEGHVELLPNRGARVRQLSLDEVEGLFSVAGALEALAGEQAAERITREELAEIRALHERMHDAFQRRDRTSYYQDNRAIHEAIVRATRNPVLLSQYAVVNARIRRIRFNSPMTEEIWERAVAEHDGMLNALSRRDAATLSGILKTHLKNKCEAIVKELRADEAAAPPRRQRRGSAPAQP